MSRGAAAAAANTVEHDFFGMEKETTSSSSNSSKSHLQKLFNRQGSFRGIQNAISKINPELLKSMMSSGSSVNQNCNFGGNANPFPSSNKSFSVPSTPRGDQTVFPALPVCNPHPPIIIRPTTTAAAESREETAPLTIFFNGSVSVFDLSRDKAENILKLAAESSGSADHQKVDQRQLIDTLNGDLPMARRKSLQRFLEKRKERLTWASPYGCHVESSAFLDHKLKKEPFRA